MSSLSDTTQSNVLFLVVDSLRHDAVFGDWETDTPAFDRLADEGLRFDHCISQGISTAPAMTAMLTGRYPLDYGGHWYLEEGQATFAEQFRRGGYTTGAIHSNPYVSARRDFDRGFDVFEEDVVAFEPDRSLERAPEKLLRLASRAARILSRRPYTPASEVNESILEFVDDADSPWFCWTQYMDVHGPYLPSTDPTYREKFRAELLWRKSAVNSPDEVTEAEDEELRANYRLEIEHLDRAVEDLLDEIDERGELDDTLVVLTADHGDEFYEHGRYGHGNLAYAELTHVPLLFWTPGGFDIERDGPVSELVRCVDILPTALDYVGVELGEAMTERMEGTSLWPIMNGEDDTGIEVALTEKRVRDEDVLRIAFRTEDWSYLYDGTDDSRRLFDLRVDPEEQRDVSESESERRETFEDRLQKRFERIRQTSENVTVPEFEEDAAVEERLRALGYKD
jgi:arylsulfatase A-like enzyme